MNNFVIALIVPDMLESLTWGAYIFFSVWCVIGGLFIYFFIPETKGKTLEEMDQVFGANTAAQDLADFAAVQEAVGLTSLVRGRYNNSEHISIKERATTIEHILKV